MKSFDEWFNNNFYDDALVKCAAKSAWGERQNEIDELQKRVDEAVYDLQHIESAMWEEQVEHVLMVLKGDQS